MWTREMGPTRKPIQSFIAAFSRQGWLDVLLSTGKVKAATQMHKGDACCNWPIHKNGQPEFILTVPSRVKCRDRQSTGSWEFSAWGQAWETPRRDTIEVNVCFHHEGQRVDTDSPLDQTHMEIPHPDTLVCCCSSNVIIARETPFLVPLKQWRLKSCQTQWGLSLVSMVSYITNMLSSWRGLISHFTDIKLNLKELEWLHASIAALAQSSLSPHENAVSRIA